MQVLVDSHTVNAPAVLGQHILRALAQKTVRATGLRPNRIEFSVAYIDARRSRDANERYRRKHGPTDILSFPLHSSVWLRSPDGYHGEILLCPTVIRAHARLHKRTVRAETTRLFVHGVLHLLGYDHQRTQDHKKMLALERRILGVAMLAGDGELG